MLVWVQKKGIEPMQTNAIIRLDRINTVGVIASLADLQVASLDPSVADLFEWRVDSSLDEGVEQGIRYLEKPIILTVRDWKEGGRQSGWGTVKRCALYEQYLDVASLIDVEASTISKLSSVVEVAKSHGKGIIISYHKLNNVPCDYEVRHHIDTHLKFGGHVFKVAVTPNSFEELCWFFERVVHWEKSYNIRIAPMAMGRFGRLSRLMAGFNRSPLIYGYLGEVSVAGQFKVSEIREMLERVW